MKKNIFVITVTLLLSLALSVCVCSAGAGSDSAEKDGIRASMDVQADPSAPENISMSVKLNNSVGGEVSNIAVTVTLPGEFRLSLGELVTPLSLPAGGAAELLYEITNTLALPETGAPETAVEPEPEPEESGCGAVISLSAVIFALALASLFIIKDRKRGTSMLLACLMLVPMLAIGAGAATSSRSFEMFGVVKYNDVNYKVYVTVSYDYTFREVQGVDTKGMEKFEITYYYGPQGQDLCNEENIKRIAECGFTSIPIEGGDAAINKTALGFVRKYGMTCSGVSDHRIQTAIEMARTGASDAELDAYLKPVVEDYREYFDVIKAWWLRDEPAASLFNALAAVRESLERLDPERETMINLFPIYASNEQLGTNGYQEYLDKFIDIVEPSYMSYDHYHFRKSGNRKDFFENLEIFRDTSIANELDPMLIILVTEHMSYVNPTKEQIEWEVNMCLTYGMKRISYFTYWLCQSLLAQGWSNAFADANGTVYQHYYDVQEINKWLLPLGQELFDKNSTAVFHAGSSSLEKGCEKYKSYGDLGQIKSSAGCVIGFFNDGSFMITNKAYNNNEKGFNTIEFLEIQKGLEYFDSQNGVWKDAEQYGFAQRNDEGILEITLKPGEGRLFRVK